MSVTTQSLSDEVATLAFYGVNHSAQVAMRRRLMGNDGRSLPFGKLRAQRRSRSAQSTAIFILAR